MSTLTCTNPACARVVSVPPTAVPGKVYACPHCSTALPPAPAPKPSSPPLVPSSSEVWTACLVLTAVIAAAHACFFLAADSAVQQAAASAAAAAWTVTAYVLARCAEKLRSSK